MINFIKSRATIGFIFLLTSLPVKSVKNDNCPTQEPCVCVGAVCHESCADGTCPPFTSCTCPSKVAAFVGEPGVLYTLPEGTFFVCGSEQTSPQTMIASSQGEEISPSGYQICPWAVLQAPSKVPSKISSFEIQPGVIYSFSQGTAFTCTASNAPPQKITATTPVEGLPSVYWVCQSFVNEGSLRK